MGCRQFSPIFEEMNGRYGNLCLFGKLDIMENKAFINKLKISSFPTIIFYKNGNEVFRHAGYLDKKKFISLIENHFL
jgi:thioredoxin-related protein